MGHLGKYISLDISYLNKTQFFGGFLYNISEPLSSVEAVKFTKLMGQVEILGNACLNIETF
jgi:hypothetical protein